MNQIEVNGCTQTHWGIADCAECGLKAAYQAYAVRVQQDQAAFLRGLEAAENLARCAAQDGRSAMFVADALIELRKW